MGFVGLLIYNLVAPDRGAAQLVLEERVFLFCRVYQVITIYPKTITKRQGESDQDLFRDQSFIQGIAHLLLRSLKRTNFLHVRDRLVDLACLNCC